MVSTPQSFRETGLKEEHMKKIVLLAAVFVAALTFSTGLYAGEATPKETMIAGKIAKVACDQSKITITGVRRLNAGKNKGPEPDVILKLTATTKFTGVKACQEITVGTVVYASYRVEDGSNVATQLILKTRMERGVKRETHGQINR
jgi:hypothetical protein